MMELTKASLYISALQGRFETFEGRRFLHRTVHIFHRYLTSLVGNNSTTKRKVVGTLTSLASTVPGIVGSSIRICTGRWLLEIFLLQCIFDGENPTRR